jgi:lactate permease
MIVKWHAISFFISWTPIVLITVLAAGLKRQALELAFWGCLYTLVLVLFWFKTPPGVVFLAGVDGFVTNLPLLLVIYSGMLLSGFLLETGSLKRVAEWFSSLTRNQWHNILLITVGSGNFMEGAGIVAEPVIAPMLRAAGLPAAGSAALSIAGYSGLMILELGGAILAVLGFVTGLELEILSRDVALMSMPATLLMVLSIPWLVGQKEQLRVHFPLLVAVGVMAGGGALFAVHFIGASVAGLFGGLVVLMGLAFLGARRWSCQRQLYHDLLPLTFLTLCLFLLNLIPPIRSAAISAWPGVITIVPGHDVHFQPLFSAYSYIFLSYGLALLLERNWYLARGNFRASNRRAWKPIWAMALFGVTGQIIAYSGYQLDFAAMDGSRNIPFILANGLTQMSGQFYPLLAPFLGWVGTFLTGYGTASIVLFGKLQVTTAHLLGVSPSLLVSGMAVGSAIGSISSPMKIALAASMCGALGREGEILRRTIPLGVGLTLALGVLLMLLLS